VNLGCIIKDKHEAIQNTTIHSFDLFLQSFGLFLQIKCEFFNIYLQKNIIKNNSNKSKHGIMKIKKKIFCFAALFLCTFFLGINSVYAQKAGGEISGVVKDKSTKETLPFTAVVIKGTAVQTVTDQDGFFRLINLEAGEYIIQFFYTGYASQELAVNLSAGEKRSVEINMSEPLVALGEVVISAQRLGQNAAINQRLNSDALVNVVSKDAIRELPDINAAEAIGRLPGISLTRNGGEGSKVILRGLDPKFASVSINGVKQPATDLASGADRSVDLSNFSPEMLSGIEVYKSPTADMDGDAIAGVVNLVISKAPDLSRNQFRVYGGYNGLNNSFGDFKASWDFSKRFLDKKLGVMAQANYDRKDRSSQGISQGYFFPDVSKPENMFISSVSLDNTAAVTKRYGVSAFVDYQFKNAGIYLNNIYNASPRENYSQTAGFDRSNLQITHDLNLTKDNTASINSTLGGNFKLPVMNIDWSLSRIQTNVNNPYDMSVQFQQRSLLDPTTDWSQVTDPRVYPDNTIFKNGGIDTLSRLTLYTFTPDTLKQVNYIAKLDIEIPFKYGDKLAGFFKFGGKYQTESRTRSGQNYRDWSVGLYPDLLANILNNDPRHLAVDANNNVLMSNFYDPRGADLLNGQYHMYAYMPQSVVSDWYNYHFKVGERADGNEMINNLEGNEDRFYKATERTMAGYVMLKLNYGNFISFVPGLRYEYSNNDYTGIYSTLSNFPSISGTWETRESNQTYGELLPSAHLKVKPVEWMDVRLSAVKTLSRPNYMWMLPRMRYQANFFQVSRSNPDLKHATAWNYDASITVYTGKFGLMSFGGYLKRINNMFYQVKGTLRAQDAYDLGLPLQSFALAQDFINLDNSYVKGLEFEYNTHFNFLPSPFNRFALGFNITRLWSGTYYLYWNQVNGFEVVRGRPIWGVDFESSSYIEMEERMPSQVDWTSNLWLGFDMKGFSTRASLAYQGTRLTSINVQEKSPAFNNYTASTLRIDFTAKQKITNMISVLLNLNNLTNETDRGYRFNTNFPTYKTMYGFTGELGVQLNF